MDRSHQLCAGRRRRRALEQGGDVDVRILHVGMDVHIYPGLLAQLEQSADVALRQTQIPAKGSMLRDMSLTSIAANHIVLLVKHNHSFNQSISFQSRFIRFIHHTHRIAHHLCPPLKAVHSHQHPILFLSSFE